LIAVYNVSSMQVDDIAEKVKEASTLLKSIGNEVRLLILCSLIEQKLTVGQLNERIDISQSALSQHLAKLRADKLVSSEKEGLCVYYSIAKPVVMEILKVLQAEFCPPEADKS